MSIKSEVAGRRERNKQIKKQRILAAAKKLFAEYGVSEVTTQQVADLADIGVGTLFLYARNKGELLLMVQNANYAEALSEGLAVASTINNALDAVIAIVRKVVECNRENVENGQAYLREMLFGDPEETYHAEALKLAFETEVAIADILQRDSYMTAHKASVIAHITSAIMLLSMGASISKEQSVDKIVAEIQTQLSILIDRP